MMAPRTPDAAVGCSDQRNFRPTLYITARSQLVLLPIFRKAVGYAFKRSLYLYTKESSLQILKLVLFLVHQDALLWKIVLMR